MHRLYLAIDSERKNVLSPQYISIRQSTVWVDKVHGTSRMDNGVDLIHEVHVVIFTQSQIQKRDVACYREISFLNTSRQSKFKGF